MNDKFLQEKTLFIEGPSGPLEAKLFIPEESFKKIGIICHPHPLYGGNMNNKVVHTLTKTLQEHQLASLRFNFRGVGKSAGSYAGGDGEADDLMGILNWIQNSYPDSTIWLAGFSFGAYIALKVATESFFTAEQLILIAPPVEHFPAMKRFGLPKCPCIVVQGDADEIVDPDSVFKWAHALFPKVTLITIQNAGHFFHGRLIELRKTLLEALP